MLKKIMLLIAAGYALVLALVLVLGLMAIAGMSRLHSIANDLYAHPFIVNDAAQEALAIMLRMRDDILDMALANDPKEIVDMSSGLSVLDKNAREKILVVETGFLGDTRRMQEVEHLLDEWRELRSREIELLRRGRKDEADNLVKSSGVRISAQLGANMDYVIGFTKRRAAAFVEEADEEAAAKIKLTQWLLAGLIASISLSGWYVARRISLLVHREEQAEEYLRKNSAQLESANKELESFSYSVSHDLRVPLRAIDGFSRILLEEYRDKLDAEGQRLLNVVRDNTRKMAQLIDDILAFAHTGRVEMSLVEINMEDMVRDVMEVLGPAAAGREIRLEIKPLPPAHADRAMMRQVLINLLDNAIKFTRPRTAAQIEVGAMDGEKEVIYYVRDNGEGFDMQYVGKLFGVFQHLHGIEEFEGSGVGLAIVKRIITRHGGRVWAEGKVNGGATIYFALPTKEKEHG